MENPDFDDILEQEKIISRIKTQRITVNTELDLQENAAQNIINASWARIEAAMKMTGEFEIEVPEHHAKIYYTTPRQSVEVDDNAAPDEYCKIERKPKKKEIKELLESGAKVNWARFKYGESKLTYRYIKEK